MEELQRKTLEDLERRLQDLPLLHSVAAKIAVMDPSSPCFAGEVEELTRRDPPFCARILRLANRPGGRGLLFPILTIPEAVARVGALPLVEFMQSFSVLEVFLPRTLGQRNLWIHALQTAVAARTVANLCPELEVPPERAYLAGLLHDIGRFVMFRESAAELGEIDETMGWNSPHALVAAEQQICGYDHAELGWLACQKWKIPEEVGMLIRDHHVYDSSACLPPEVARLMRIVQTADILSVVLLVNSGLLNRKLQEQYPVLDQALSVRSWTPPIDAGALAPRLPEVDAESHGLAASLGLVE